MSAHSDGYFFQYFESLAAASIDLNQVLWVVPRVDASALLKRQWQSYLGGGSILAPHIAAADRMSQPRAVRPWLNCQAQLVQTLIGKPELVKSLSGEQIWTLAHEYLNYAMRLALVRQAGEAVQRYIEQGPFSEQEAQVILSVSEIFEHELRALCVQPDPLWASLNQVIWFDDGESVPGDWLQAFLPHLPVHRIELPKVSGPVPWQDFVQRKHQGQLVLSTAPDEITQSQQAAATIMEWLALSPEESVAVAVSDRLSARRLVPLLSQKGIEVDDRTGWRLSTSAMAGWLNGLLSEVSQAGQLSFLAHPLSGEPCAPLIQPPVSALGLTLSQWAGYWLSLFDAHDWTALLMGDEAGALLLQGLRHFQAVEFEGTWSAQQFQEAWRHQTETKRFKPVDAQSPVRLMPLLSTRLGRYKRVLALGCAQSHFQESPPGLLPPSVAQDMGFAGPSLGRVQQISALWDLADGADQIVFSHAQSANGRPESLLPELQYVDVLLKQARASRERESGEFSPWQRSWPAHAVTVHPSPIEPLAASAHLMNAKPPTQLRVTALDEFVVCPLQFGLRQCLPFPDTRERTAMSYYQLRGVLVHQVLEKATVAMRGRANATDFRTWLEPLKAAMDEAYLDLDLASQAEIYAFVESFGHLVPRLAGQLAARVAQDWRAESSEQEVTGRLTLNNGKTIGLRGRVDRIERRGDELAVVDFKFKKASDLRKLATSPLESPQLPAYQALLDRHDAQLMYLSIDTQSVEWVPIEPPAPDSGWASWGEGLWLQLSRDLSEFFEGGLWQARPGDACAYCDAVGICRPNLDAKLAEPQEQKDDA